MPLRGFVLIRKLTAPRFGPLCLKMRGAERTARERMSMENRTESAYGLAGRQALVTGGASGIGESTVKELVRAGAFVWIADINLAAAEKLAALTGSANGGPRARRTILKFLETAR